MKKMLVMSLAAASVFMLAACGGGGTTAGGPASPTATAGTPTPTETSGEVRIAMEDNFFQPNSLTVASGAELELDNEGGSPHTFTIKGQGVDVQVNAGENGKVTLDLEPGTYDFVCRFHEAMGMKGTITVSG